MDRQHWHNQNQNHNYSQYTGFNPPQHPQPLSHQHQHQQPHVQQGPQGGYAVSGTSGAEGLMALHPPASATPVTHVARHIMNTVPPLPRFVPQQSYTLNGALDMPPHATNRHPPNHAYAQQPSAPPPPFAEHTGSVAQLSARSVPQQGTQQRQHWDHHQREAVRLLSQPQQQQQTNQYGHDPRNVNGAHPQQQFHTHSQQNHQNNRNSLSYHASDQQRSQNYTQSQPQAQYYTPPSSWSKSSFEANPFATAVLQGLSQAQASSPRSYSYNNDPSLQLPPMQYRPSSSNSLSMALVEPPSARRNEHSHRRETQQHVEPSFPQSQPQPQPSPMPQQYQSSQFHPPPTRSIPQINSRSNGKSLHLHPQGQVYQPLQQAPPVPPPVKNEFRAEDSSAFFDDFLTRTAKEMKASNKQVAFPPPAKLVVDSPSAQPKPPYPSAKARTETDIKRTDAPVPEQPRPSKASVPAPIPAPLSLPSATTPRKRSVHLQVPNVEESPDPMALGASVSRPALVSSFTPRKRKLEETLPSPTETLRLPFRGSSKTNSAATPTNTRTLTPTGSASSINSKTSTGRRMLYVELPTLASLRTPTHKSSGSASAMAVSPSKNRRRDGAGSGSDEDRSMHGSVRRPNRAGGIMTTGPRTGDRDQRGPLEKLTSLLEDIFEAEDSLPPDADASAFSSTEQLSQFFSSLTLDFSRPLLNTAIIAKLTRSLTQVARPAKRIRLASRDGKVGTPFQAGLGELDVQVLQRILKVLGRSVRLGEDVEPFAGPPASAEALAAAVNGGGGSGDAPKAGKGKKKAPAKKKAPNSGGKGRAKSATPKEDAGGMEVDGHQHAVSDLTEEDYTKLERNLDVAKEAVLAADGCLALLSADKLPKQLYSEELISSCLTVVKHLLMKVIYPFVEATSDIHGQSSALLVHVVHDTHPDTQSRRKLIGEIFQALSAAIPRITVLVGRADIAMSDALIIQAVYIAIGPFFAGEFGGGGEGKGGSGKGGDKHALGLVMSTLGGVASLRGLRLSALSLIRSIFAHHKDQRSWIIEEILSSLIQLPDLKQKSGQYKLRDGRSIHTVSALLLQLVQTSAHDVHVEGDRFAKARLQLVARSSSQTLQGSEDQLLSDRDQEELGMYKSGLDSTNSVAKSIIGFLTLRSGQGKLIKNTKEADYRAIFDNLVSDLLTVLYWPEWPAAGLLLGIVTIYLRNALSESKSSNANDSNGAKSMALDHLGVIAARLRTISMRQAKSAGDSSDGPLKSLEEIVASCDFPQLDRLISAYEDVSAHLVKRSSEDQACDSARELNAASWGQDIARTICRCNTLLQKMQETRSETDQQYQDQWKLTLRLLSTLKDVWQESPTDVFDVGSDADVARLDLLAEQIGSVQHLTGAFDIILNAILSSLNAPAVFMRTKGLRALGQVLTADPSALRNANVRRAIESHLHDQSPAVRDAAVELIGKYIVQMPDLLGDYYPVISNRIADTGLGVRKRIIKLLKSMYSMTDGDLSRQIDIGTKLVSRMSDEDDGVKDLAVKTLEELWLGDSHDTTTAGGPNSTAHIIMGVAGELGEKLSSLDDFFHHVASSKEGKEVSSVIERYKAICEVLIGSIVDSETSPGFSLVNCVKTVHLLVAAHPPIVTTAHAKSLLPYLKNTTSREEKLISDYILKIYIACMPSLPKTASQFAGELQQSLSLGIQKPSNLAALPECISCFCSVIQNLTHDFSRLTGLLKSCNSRISQFMSKKTPLTPPEMRSMTVIVYMLALLCEHCDFDLLREEKPALAADLNAVSKDSITDHVFDTLLRLFDTYTDNAVKGPVLRCLGSLFRAKPTLMTQPASAGMMDEIFASEDEDTRGRLLKIMQNFLISESEKYATLQRNNGPKVSKASKAINMEELVGNTGGFAESGVSSAVVQRYLPAILTAALSKQPQIQLSAVDILSFTVKQGLAHPLQCMPVLIALETSPAPSISSRAYNLHSILFSKHPGLINSRHLECARQSYDYQLQVNKNAIRGFRLNPNPIALMHRWYTLVREKRQMRQDLLKALMKTFDLDPSELKCSQADIDFVRYMAENLSALEFKSQEEVLTVIKHLTTVLSVTGTQLMALFAPPPLVGELLEPPSSDPSHTVDSGHQQNGAERPRNNATEDFIPSARASVLIGMALLLKAYLKAEYGLSEDKCTKWVPGKKSALGDKAATRRNTEAISWDRMPYVSKPILVLDDAIQQKERFVTLWEEDGVHPEPEDMDL